MSPLKLAVFDLDGTLIDTIDDIRFALNTTLAHYKFPPLTKPEVMAAIGDSVDQMLKTAVRHSPEVDITEFRAHYRDLYRSQIDAHSQLYDGVRDVLDQLRSDGIKMAVLTNKPENPARRLITLFKLGHYFEIVAGPDTYNSQKPDPVGLQSIMSAVGATPQETVMIGDGDTDVLTGKAAGTRTISLTYGYRNHATLAALNPDAIADSMTMVASLLKSL